MATFQITGPDGKKYRVSGENAEGAFQALQQHLGATQPEQSDPRDSLLGRADAAVRGVADTLSLGFADEIAAGLGTGFGMLGNYDEELARQRGIDASDSEDRFGYRLGGQIAGGVGGGLGLARNGLSLGANAVNRGASLGRVAAASAGEGAALGGAHGFGSGEGVGSRIGNAAIGGGVGLGLGAAAPYAIAGVQRGLGMAAAPLTARLFPERYAQRAIGEGIQRSGMSVDDIANALARSQADDQGMFTVADAMGNSGQRMLSTVARNPSDARQGVVDALLGRQMDQGRRVASSLAESSGAPWTAERYADFLRSARSADAARNYRPVQQDITPINVSDAIRIANRSISPLADNIPAARNVPTDIAARSGVEAGESSIRDPIRQAVKEARSYLASDNLTVTNVEKAFRAKTNIDQMIAKASESGKGGTVDALLPMQKALDDALAATSKPYATARDAYRSASQNIDAIEIGREMTKGRTRVDDNLHRFSSLSPDQQQAARVGYFDPLIARAEDTVGTMTNSARPFVSESARRELPAFAEPGTSGQLMDRLSREQRMFETASTALGGSKTADNLADAAEMAKFDPGVMAKMLRGDFIGAAMDGIRRVGSEASGTPPRVIEQIAEALMQTNPSAARQFLTASSQRMTQQEALRAQIVAALTGSTSAGAGRVLAP